MEIKGGKTELSLACFGAGGEEARWQNKMRGMKTVVRRAPSLISGFSPLSKWWIIWSNVLTTTPSPIPPPFSDLGQLHVLLLVNLRTSDSDYRNVLVLLIKCWSLFHPLQFSSEGVESGTTSWPRVHITASGLSWGEQNRTGIHLWRKKENNTRLEGATDRYHWKQRVLGET